MAEASSDWPQTSTVLLDHIRSLRQPIPSEIFSDSTAPDVRSSRTLQSTSIHPKESSSPPNVGPAIHGIGPANQPPVPNLRTSAAGQRLPRPAPYSALNSEDLTRTPKERLRAFLAPRSSSGTRSDLPVSSGSIGQRSSSPARKSSGESQRSLAAASGRASASDAQPSSVAMEPSLDSNNATSAAPAGTTTFTTHSPTPSLDISLAKDADSSAIPSTSVSNSAEIAFQTLTKDKEALVSRNEQLWKLVEKQRAMILGLNQDLEKAVKDRERYRKRLREKEKERPKELLAASQPAPPAAKLNETSQAAPNTSQLTSVGAQTVEMEQKPRHEKEASIDSSLSVPKSSPPKAEAVILDSMAINSVATADDARPYLLAPQPLRLRQENRDLVDQESSLTTSPSSQTKSPGLSSPGESKRKAPPQPLNLSQAQLSVNLAAAEEAVDSGSDYEERSPQVERGRRKTREDDDRLREAVFLEEERRSRSDKASKSESKGKSKSQSKQPSEPGAARIEPDGRESQPRTTELPAGLASNVGLPTSPRAGLLGALQSPLQPSNDSISSVLRQIDRPVAKFPVVSQSQPQDVEMALKSPGLPLKSPGLPMSPRPGDRPAVAATSRPLIQHLAGPGPMSPRSAMVLSPRAPRQPIPLPQSSPFIVSAPHMARPEQSTQQQSQLTVSMERNRIGDCTDIRRGDTTSDPANLDQIHRGLVSDQYPEFLLPPNALPLIEVKVDSSRLRPSRNNYLAATRAGEEDSIFTLAVRSRSDESQLWRVEKALVALPILDQSLRRSPDFNAKLPDKNLFTGHAPARIDMRRAALNQYFDAVLDTPLEEKIALAVCDFLSSDVIGPRPQHSAVSGETGLGRPNVDERRRKEGYLAKKGKQLGGWKARYFILDGSELRYFEGPNGGHLGHIKLHKAQIAKQNAEETAEDAEYRHAFMILEPKRKDSTSLTRHVLCAESDEERDGWVEALLAYVDTSDDDNNSKTHIPKRLAPDPAPSRHGQEHHSATPSLQSVSYDQTVAADAPTRGSPGRSSESPSPVDNSSEFGAPSILSPADRPNISGPVAGGPIQNSQAWGNKSPSMKDLDLRKRNIFGFRSRASEDSAQPQQTQQQQKDSRSSSVNGPSAINTHNGRAVFGISLNEAADFFSPNGVDICLPAPVYRCIEYLEAKNATNEEGIFRMSGSNVVIKQIKERFNSEGDVKLLEGQYYDIHAVASVLKLYLRELPESVLTREHHLDFLKVLETEDRTQRVSAVNVLAHRLPEANFELLATLSRFLIDIVNNADVNKMNVRNVGIVFAPTLNIPAPLISLFLTDHESIFGNALAASSSPIVTALDSPSASSPSSATPTGADDLRSPRKQMFTDLATPAYNQINFPTEIHGDSFNPYQYRQQQQQQQQRQHSAKVDFDIGFNPIQRSHEASHPLSANPPALQIQHRKPTQLADPGGVAFGSLNAAMASSGPSQLPPSTERADS